jgi:hypothetical protein
MVTVNNAGTRRLHGIDLAGAASIDDWLYVFVEPFEAARAN